VNASRAGRFRVVALVLALSGLLGACGSQGSSGSPADGADSSRLVLGFSAWPGWFPWQVAAEKGIFTRNGLDVELKFFDTYSDSLDALQTARLHANSQTLNDTLSSVSRGSRQRVVLVMDNSTGNDQIIAREGIRDIAGLRGKRVAAEQGTVDHFLLLLALKKAGMTERDVRFVPLATAAAATAFVSGQVDAVGVFAPFTTTALERRGSRVLATSADYPGAISDHLVFTQAYADEHPERVQAMVKSWFETLDWIKGHQAEAVAIMARRGDVAEVDYRAYEKGMTLFTVEQNIAAFSPGEDPTHLNHQVGVITDFMLETKLTDVRPDSSGMLDGRFVQALKR
jgi:NitT/TauT family transport system substrate-binding protein